MPSLQNIKTRINTVKSTQKITKAMELVAFSKLRKSKELFYSIREYTDRVENVFLNLDANIKNWEEVYKTDPTKPRIFILINSDLGLCGGYNANIFRHARKDIAKEDFIIAIGTRGAKWVSSNYSKEKILATFPAFGDDINGKKSAEIIEQITKLLCDFLESQNIRSIHLLYTSYINSLTYDVVDKKIFPFSRTERLKFLKHNPISGIMEFEPDSKTVLRSSLPLYINAILLSKLANSKLSEISSRQSAMESASENAEEIINNLQKEYNKIRQAKITQEISEIIAGADNE